MKWMLLYPLRTLPPIGLVALGAVVGAVGVPVARKTARSLAVMTVKGAHTIREGWQDLMEEARSNPRPVRMHEGSPGKEAQVIDVL